MTPDERAVLAVQLANVDRKLDAVHSSLKEDIGELKHEARRTNGRVTGLERRYSELRGIGLALLAITPFALLVLQKLF